MFETIFRKMTPDCDPTVLELTIQLAVDMGGEGREGKRFGTILVLGDEEETLKRSLHPILDPHQGHPSEHKKIHDFNLKPSEGEVLKNENCKLPEGRKSP